MPVLFITTRKEGFAIYSYASEMGLRAVLMQDGNKSLMSLTVKGASKELPNSRPRVGNDTIHIEEMMILHVWSTSLE